VNFSVNYQLPNASGESSRARFGVSAPIPITDHLSANVSASVLRALGNGVFTASGTVALRYRQAGFAATGSVEVGRDFGAQDGRTANRLILRGGASGSLTFRLTAPPTEVGTRRNVAQLSSPGTPDTQTGATVDVRYAPLIAVGRSGTRRPCPAVNSAATTCRPRT